MFFRTSRKLDRVLASQARIEALLKAQGATLSKTTIAFAALQAAVAAQVAVDQSAVTLIEGIAQQLKENAADPAAVQALADQLTGASAPLAQAVLKNTPAAPATPAAPVPDPTEGTTTGAEAPATEAEKPADVTDLPQA